MCSLDWLSSPGPSFLNWLFLICLGISPEYHAHTHAHTHAHSHTHLHLHPSQQAQAQQEAAAAAAGFPLPGKLLLKKETWFSLRNPCNAIIEFFVQASAPPGYPRPNLLPPRDMALGLHHPADLLGRPYADQLVQQVGCILWNLHVFFFTHIRRLFHDEAILNTEQLLKKI